jgi:hypothetical protein
MIDCVYVMVSRRSYGNVITYLHRKQLSIVRYLKGTNLSQFTAVREEGGKNIKIEKR